jgi:hypothetical protein
MDVLYLQASYSKNQIPLRGRKLLEAFERNSERCRVAYIVRESADAADERYRSDVVTFSSAFAITISAAFAVLAL